MMMEEVVLGGGVSEEKTKEENAVDSMEELDDDRPLERWAPLGASHPSPVPDSFQSPSISKVLDEDRLTELEDEQEQLNTALLELTTHFAQVQFRLQQINKVTDPQQKEKLLAELTDFASQGCPDILEVKRSRNITRQGRLSSSGNQEHDAILEMQRAKQLELISQLKGQLEDLERFAYEAGEGGLPSSELMEKQRVIIDSLQDKIDLKVEQLEKLTHEDLQRHVDQAVKRLINPMKLKDSLVEQLKTQIDDLHRFVEFLQSSDGQLKCTCLEADQSGEGEHICMLHHPERAKLRAAQRGFGAVYNKPREEGETGLFRNAVALVQIYVLAQLGCQSQQFRKNELKKTSKGNHWGDLRAALTLAVDKVCEVATRDKEVAAARGDIPVDSSEDEDDEEDDVFTGASEELVGAVRKNLSQAIRDLLQHGLLQPGYASGSSLVPFGCFPTRSREAPVATSSTGEQTLHAWDIILKYYDMKHGREFSEMPMRKLSQSFRLDTVGGKTVTSKQLLLSTIDTVLSSHTKLKRSPDAHLRAFICAALNHKRLVPWLRMILRTREIIEENYATWSYVARTRFEDGFTCLERLQDFTFHLPVDLAVRPFKNIKDAF